MHVGVHDIGNFLIRKITNIVRKQLLFYESGHMELKYIHNMTHKYITHTRLGTL